MRSFHSDLNPYARSLLQLIQQEQQPLFSARLMLLMKNCREVDADLLTSLFCLLNDHTSPLVQVAVVDVWGFSELSGL